MEKGKTETVWRDLEGGVEKDSKGWGGETTGGGDPGETGSVMEEGNTKIED